jgi:transcriptional regulator with XRE-family HTH domain
VKKRRTSKKTGLSESRRPLANVGGEPALAELPERIRASLAARKIEEVAKKIGVSPSAIYNWFSGTNEPSLAKLFALAEITRTSPAWLIVGQGLPDSIPGYVRPIYKTQAAPFAFERRWLEANVEQRSTGSIHLIELPDDSMRPTMEKGDFLLFQGFGDQNPISPVNGIYAVSLKTEPEPETLEDLVIVPKRVEWSSREDAILKCDNPAYPLVMKFNARLENQEFEIVGRVVWHGHLI